MKGQRGLIKVGKLIVFVKIKDTKNSYGHTRYLITPVMGSGEQWVQKIELIKK